MPAHKRRSNIVGSIACVLLALLALGFGLFMLIQVQRMEAVGIHADAVVTQIKSGAKNSKTPIVAFKTADGAKIEAKCIFQMFVIRYETGDKVTVLYDPSNPETVMIDNGMWNWDQPAFGVLSGFVLLLLAVVIFRSQPKSKE